MRRWILLVILAVCGAGAGRSEETASSAVTYVSGATVYVASGRDQGLREGDLLEVVRDGRAVGRLKVTFLSTSSCSCEIVSQETELKAGDIVRHAQGESEQAGPVPPPPAPSPVVQTPRPARRSQGWLRDNGVRGRVGMRLSMLNDRGAAARRVAQPGLDIRLDGQDVGGSPIDLAVDVRTRQTYKNGARSDTRGGNTRVYRLSGAWQGAGSSLRMTAGRQQSTALATVGIFDGALLENLNKRWSFGLLSGTQPDPLSYGTSTEIWENGVYCQRSNGPEEDRRYALVAGLIGSYRRGVVNREFLYLQQRFDHEAGGASLAEEVDLNRAWKEGAGERRISFTSFYGQSRLRLLRGLDLRAGFDNRRNVRLYRDRVTPETEFDDSYRQGISLGSTLRLGPHLDLGADARSSKAGGSMNDSYTANLGVAQITRAALGLRIRSTRYRSDRLDGWLHSAYLTASPLGILYLEIRGGLREERARGPVAEGRVIRWIGGDADISVSRRLYLVVSEERTRDAGNDSDQIYLRASLRY